jgi:curved DNA-binding protein CbpA
MKKIKNILMLSLLAVVFATSSCSDFLDVNKDPNRVTGDNVTPNLIFTNAESSVGRRQATRFIFLNNWMGYWGRSGTFVVDNEETTYKITNNFTENNFDDAYNVLFDLNQAQVKALAAKDSVLTGASMVLSAKLWQETVDLYGAIPYSQAFDYATYPLPAYTKASDIYTDLLVQLDKAIVYLNVIQPKTTFTSTDIIFCRGGNLASSIAKWKKLANTIKLRIYLRQSEKGFVPSSAQLSKITSDGGFLGAGENVSVNPGYANDLNKQNPFYAAFGLTPSGSAATTNNTPNKYFTGTVLGSTDPRLSRFFASPIAATDYGVLGGNLSGGPTIVGSGMGPGLAVSSTADQFILPSFESLFFQAEATLRGWLPGGDAAAQTLYQSAVQESFNWLGVPSANTAAPNYYTGVTKAIWPTSGTTADKIKFVAYQKYIALCGVDPLESYSDLRRLGVFIPVGYLSWNAVRAASLPNVLTYPQGEFTTNSANIPTPVRSTTTIFTEKLFWQP